MASSKNFRRVDPLAGSADGQKVALVSTSDLRPPGSRAEGARLRSLASMARALGRSGGVLDVVERAITEGYRVVDAESGSVSVLDRPAGLVRVLVNVGDLTETEAGRPTDETYRIADFPSSTRSSATFAPGRAHARTLMPTRVSSPSWSSWTRGRRSARRSWSTASCGASSTSPATPTGLANRRLLDQLAATIVPARTDVVVVSFDVNGLKQVNDQRAARTGGDEFCLLARHTDVCQRHVRRRRPRDVPREAASPQRLPQRHRGVGVI